MTQLETYFRQLLSNPVFDGFEDANAVFYQFEKDVDDDIIIVHAHYESHCYEGSASVYYYRTSTDKFYEIYGSHCSCYGLEGQWDREEEVCFEELEKRFTRPNA